MKISSIYYLIVFSLIIFFSTELKAQTYTINSASWQDQVDQDGDTYTRSRTLILNITASQNTTCNIQLWKQPNGGSNTVYLVTDNFAVFSGTNNYSINNIGTSTYGELSNSAYDFSAFLRNTSGSTLAYITETQDPDMGNEKFETAAEDQQLTTTIDNVTWSDQVDQDSDTYTRSRTMNISITASQNTTAILEIRAWPDGQSEVLYGNTSAFAVFAGTYSYTVPIGAGSSIGGEISHDTYDFRVLLRTGVNGTILAQRGPNDDGDLNNELFETSNEDTPFTLNIDNVTWSDQVDQDSDTYTRSRTMNITYTSNQSITGALELRSWVDGQSEASYSPINSFSIFSGTNTYSTTIGTGGVGGELSHNTYDFRVLLRENASGSIWAQRGPNDDGDLNNENYETASEDQLPVNITITANPVGRSIVVDGSTYTAPQIFSWIPGSQHNIGTNSPQAGTTGTQYVWNNWSDGGAMNHTITVPSSNTTYTANFTTQYYLTTAANPPTGGTVSPQGGWYNSGTQVQISATTNSGYFWNGWVGTGTISYTGTNNPASVTMNGPITETANFGTNPQITITTNPSGRSFTVNGNNYTSPQTFNWAPGSQQNIGTNSPQAGTTGTQYVWNNWSDGGAMTHTITIPTNNTTYTSNFTTQYYLTVVANPSTGGTVSPQSGWYNSGSGVQISASTNNGYFWNGWVGTGTISYTGTNNPANVTMNSPITETANFGTNPQVTITTYPVGRSFTVDGANYNSPQTFSWSPGSSHSLGTILTQAGGTGIQYIFENWSDGGSILHTITAPSSNTTYTANFTTQYYLTMNINPSSGGTMSPQSGWYNAGSSVQISASTNNGYFWNGWVGTGTVSYTGTNNPASVTMNSPITETANFGNIVIPIANPATNITQTSFTANWTTSSGATGYKLDVTTDNTFSYQTWDLGNVTSYNVTGVTSGTNWYYRLRAVVGTVISDPSNNQSVLTIPPNPVAQQATDTTQISFTANWSASTGATGYRLDVSDNSSFTTYVSGYENLDVENVTTQSVIGLTSGTTYYFRIRAYNTSGVSDPSNVISVKTKIGTDVLDMISGIPDNYSLSNNYPNPFNPSTKIQFGLPEESNSTLKVYDILGSEVITLLDNETLSAGSYSYNLVADGLPSGIYIYVLTTKSNFHKRSLEM